jgi:hypothetical protein
MAMSYYDAEMAKFAAGDDYEGMAAYVRKANPDRLFIMFLTDYTVEDLEARIASKPDQFTLQIAKAFGNDTRLEREEINACGLAINILRGNSTISRANLVRLLAWYRSDEELNEIIDRKQQDYETKSLSRAVEGANLAAIDRDMGLARSIYTAAAKALANRANKSL